MQVLVYFFVKILTTAKKARNFLFRAFWKNTADLWLFNQRPVLKFFVFQRSGGNIRFAGT